MAKKTDTELAPEPVGWLNSWSVHEGTQAVLVYECQKCLSLVSSLAGHELMVHPIS